MIVDMSQGMSTKRELKSFPPDNPGPAAAAEWEPWIARKLELGSLPLYEGLAVVAVALMPSVAVIAIGTYLNDDAYGGLYFLTAHAAWIQAQVRALVQVLAAAVVMTIQANAPQILSLPMELPLLFSPLRSLCSVAYWGVTVPWWT